MFYYAITTFFGRFGDNYRQNGIYRAAMTVMREEESFLRSGTVRQRKKKLIVRPKNKQPTGKFMKNNLYQSFFIVIVQYRAFTKP